MTITRPLLAAKCEDITRIDFPVIATPKIDGIRCLKVNGKALARSMKLIPNCYIRSLIEQPIIPDGLDGELLIPNCTFQWTMSSIMSHDGTPAFKWYLFDYIYDAPYNARYTHLRELQLPDWCYVLPEVWCNTLSELQDYIDQCLKQGLEGVCFRRPHSRHKNGRSTFREQILIKWKPIQTSKAIVKSCVELMHNTNAVETNEIGLSKRSKEQSGMIPGDTLGALVVEDPAFPNVLFNIGTGFTARQRAELWDRRNELPGTVVEYAYQPIGVLNAPRCPVFKRFRSTLDT